MPAKKTKAHEDVRNDVIIWLSIAGFVLTVFGFIWFEYRPIVIRKQCYVQAHVPHSSSFLESQYRTCLAQNGLEI
ncbi:MAG: hypothetical protein COU47_02535 [Candidatus Niyogibacteria bacterium CG10_big_fil_rev_8_21_14_0_10_46_36]|uniref:Uncharacterized protein n=1 Tax=Candidatus Niyogibacteria bacterium CG10_big_fil_rev_8_21_14_0_10_46_36 TaxID=1974726 RepID=A0A2H0TDH3_9BACT|nr:MAG: hypothetical protein COU47_02535 [Candidatus Niyogibacteria bacterium CG10_big_fil_rev_8_21_14_0_10_46_36]